METNLGLILRFRCFTINLQVLIHLEVLIVHLFLQNSPVDPYVCNEKSRLRKDFPELLNEIVLQAAVDSGW